jgi:ribonuclease P protein component
MFAQKNRIKNKKEFEKIFKKGKGFDSDFLFLKVINNSLEYSRFAVVVSKKVSNKAVIRNKVKRRLREILKKRLLDKKGLDIVLIAKPGIEQKDFKELENKADIILKRAKLL